MSSDALNNRESMFVKSSVESHKRNPCVLTVDDDVDAVGFLSELLMLSGFDPIVVTSGDQALEYFSKIKPDIVLTDIQMPGMDGIKLLKKIRELDESIPVILLTGHGETENAIKALRLGAYDFLLKPINAEILISTLERAAKHCRLENLKMNTPTDLKLKWRLEPGSLQKRMIF